MKTAPMMKMNQNIQRGFSLITAIFLLVVLASLGAVMMTFFTAQQQSSALDVMGSRAYQAARAGIEWGAYQVLRNDSCAAPTPLPALGGTLSPFTVTVGCITTSHDEGTRTAATSNPVQVYLITATAKYGVTPGSADYVERQMQVNIWK